MTHAVFLSLKLANQMTKLLGAMSEFIASTAHPLRYQYKLRCSGYVLQFGFSQHDEPHQMEKLRSAGQAAANSYLWCP